MAPMKNPTEQEMAEVHRREFPACRLSNHERGVLAFIHIARSHGVGYGWMRQAIGLAWKMADPIGYIDNQRVYDLFAAPALKALRDLDEDDALQCEGHADEPCNVCPRCRARTFIRGVVA